MNRMYLNLGLLAVVAALGATVYFTQKKEETGPPLTALKRDAITRIALEHPGKPAIRLEKKDARWVLTEPVQADTDSFEINGILELAEREVKARLDAGVNLADLELEPPQYSVTLDDTRIDLGGVEPMKARRYVRSGDVIGLVDDPPGSTLDADYSELVARALVPETAVLSRIELPGLLLEKNAEGNWSSPQQGDAPAAQVARLAESWKNARAMWNAAAPAAAATPAAVAATDAVRLTLADGRLIDLVVAERDPQLVLARPDLGVRYTLSKVMVDELFTIPEVAVEVPPEGEPAAVPAVAEPAAGGPAPQAP